MKKIFIVSLVLAFFLSHSEASKQVTIQKIRYSSHRNYTRVVIDADGPIEFTSNYLSKPDRLYFNLKDCILTKKTGFPISVNDGILKSVRVAQFDRKTVRVVLDLQSFKKFYTFTLEDPYRLVIDVYNKKPSKTQKQSNVAEKDFSGIRRIVIDPGHGGKDPGAIGPRGLREKDVVLDVAKKLGKILEKEYGVEVIYTRKKNVFVPLNERTEIANSRKADLFISIHANASKKRYKRGIETYFLNWTNDKEAMRVAARENKISFKKMQKAQDDLQMILLSLARANKSKESMELAYSVQNAIVNTLKRDYRRVEDHRVKWALFYVLVGAEMPSILVEISFITNREEERRLSTSRYRYKIADAIAKGVGAYIKKSTLIVKRVNN